MKRSSCQLWLVVAVLGALWTSATLASTYYVDVKYTGGNSDGSTNKPWTNMAPAAAAFTNGTGHTIMVAAGLYLSTSNAGGYETFGTNGYTVINGSGSFAGTWKGGYKGWNGSTFDWTEASRGFPRATVDTNTMTVIDLTNANARAFAGYDGTRDTLTVVFDGFVFRNSNVSQANYNGGALLLGSQYAANASGAPRLYNCVFLYNTTTGEGGALWFQGRYALSTNLWFVGNHAGSRGGGGFFSGKNDSVTVSNIVCIGNSSGSSGGAICGAATLVVAASTFIGNTAVTAGGAVTFAGLSTDPGNETVTLRQCVFTNNTAGTYGGAFGLDQYRACTLSVENCLIASNKASSGYAVYVGGAWISDSRANLFLRHCTIADNNNGGAMASITGDNVAGYTNVLSATNCIIANNGPVGLNAYDGGKSNFAFGIDYNIVYGQTTNYAGLATNALHSNDLNVNPKFIGGGNYKLQGASLAADSGINIGVSNDLVNVVRPLGAGFDRGCYEGKRVASGTTAFFR